jgi:hypothetical protein
MIHANNLGKDFQERMDFDISVTDPTKMGDGMKPYVR